VEMRSKHQDRRQGREDSVRAGDGTAEGSRVRLKSNEGKEAGRGRLRGWSDESDGGGGDENGKTRTSRRKGRGAAVTTAVEHELEASGYAVAKRTSIGQPDAAAEEPSLRPPRPQRSAPAGVVDAEGERKRRKREEKEGRDRRRTAPVAAAAFVAPVS
ncbi:unnamed protein product, partial [Polarella glacialis]